MLVGSDEVPEAADAPESQIITLCGSARFERLFKAWNEALTMAGHTVFSLTAYPSDKAGVRQWYTEEQKKALDAAHCRKIKASNAIFVLNRHAYIGDSTLREIECARELGKAVYFLESWGQGFGISGAHTEEAQRSAKADGLTLPTASPIDTTTRSGSRDPWASSLLGPAGAVRSSIVELTKSAAFSAPPPAGAQQAVAWAAVHFGGKRNGKIYNTCDTREQIDAYIGQVHQSNDSITLTARPLVFADTAPAAAEGARDEDDQYTLDRSADLLERYIDFIKRTHSEEIEQHPYLPELESTTSDLRAFAARPTPPATPATEAAPTFQARVKPWLLECFGEAIAGDREERNHRFLEEALELVQACGCTASEAHQLVDYTFGRPVGEKSQEVGGVMVTLAALCLAQDLDMHAEGEIELARISVPELVARIRAKHEAKPKHSPLPAAASEAAKSVTLDRGQIEDLRRIIHDENSPLGNRLQDVSSRLYFALDGAGWTPSLREATPAAGALINDNFAADWLTSGASLHPMTINLVVRFARALAGKLADAEKKYGFTDGWLRSDWMVECREKLREHVQKGDPRDVAAYCAFLWHHDERTAAPPLSAAQQPAALLEKARFFVADYALKNVRWTDGGGVKQDPHGVHALLSDIDRALEGSISADWRS